MRSRNTRLTGIMAAVAVGALVVGCSDAGSSTSSGGSTPSSVRRTISRSTVPSEQASSAVPTVVTLAEARSMQSTYDQHNNAAIARAAVAPYDQSAWDAVDSGPTRAIDTFYSRVDRYEKNTDATPLRTTVSAAWGSATGSSDGGAPWVALAADTSRVGASSTAAPPSSAAGQIRVMVREAAGWRMFAGVSTVPTASMPRSVAPTTLTPAQRSQAMAAARTMYTGLLTGRTTGIANPAEVKKMHQTMTLERAESQFTITAKCAPWGTTASTDVARAPLLGTTAFRTMRLGSATLGLLSLDCTVRVVSRGSTKWSHDSAAIAAANGDDLTPKKSMTFRYATVILLSVDSTGRTRLLGHQRDYIVPRGK